MNITALLLGVRADYWSPERAMVAKTVLKSTNVE